MGGRRDEVLRFQLSTLQEKIDTVLMEIVRYDSEIGNIDFQVDTYRHDQDRYREQHKTLKTVPVVSLNEYRHLNGELEFMTDLLAALASKRKTLGQKRQAALLNLADLQEEQAVFKRQLDVIQSESNVIPFPNDQRRDEIEDPDRS